MIDDLIYAITWNRSSLPAGFDQLSPLETIPGPGACETMRDGFRRAWKDAAGDRPPGAHQVRSGLVGTDFEGVIRSLVAEVLQMAGAQPSPP